MDPSLILGHNSTHKFLRVIFLERPGDMDLIVLVPEFSYLLRNIKPALLVIFGQHSRDASS